MSSSTATESGPCGTARRGSHQGEPLPETIKKSDEVPRAEPEIPGVRKPLPPRHRRRPFQISRGRQRTGVSPIFAVQVDDEKKSTTSHS